MRLNALNVFTQHIMRTINTKRFIVQVAVMATGAGILVGCSPGEPECQSGAGSAPGAVTRMLDAAVAGDLKLACQVTPVMTDEDLRTTLAEITTFVSAAGGIKEIKVVEDESARLGSGHMVDAIASGGDVVTFSVVSSSNVFIVYPDNAPDVPSGRETTNPLPRPAESE